MRQLDSERQSLVYNHHHELIAATDTISAVCFPHGCLVECSIRAKMKTRAESLDADLAIDGFGEVEVP